MDNTELLRLGAQALIDRLCREIEDTIATVPSVEKYARDLVRRTFKLGTGKPPSVNGSTAAKLANDLIVARAHREPQRHKTRPPMTDAQKQKMSKIAKARWAKAKALGVKGVALPTNRALASKAKATTPSTSANADTAKG